MPPQQAAATNVLAKIANRVKAAVMSAAGKPVEMGGQDDLPPGIKNGVCQISDIGFFVTKPESTAKKADGTSAVGEPYFQATGVIIEPEDVVVGNRKVKVKGRQTRLYIPVYDTKPQNGEVTLLEQHLGGTKGPNGEDVAPARKNVRNELLKLGAPELLFTQMGGDLEKVAAVVKKAAPYFNFSTSERKNQATGVVDGAWENWNGVEGLADYKPGGPTGDAVLDESAHLPPTESAKVANRITGGKAETPTTTGRASSPPPPPAAPKQAPAKPAPVAAAPADDDLDVLLADATGEDEAAATTACDRLRVLAKAIGKTDDEVENAAGWEDVVGWIKAGAGGATGGGAVPALEDVYMYTVNGKAVEHEVTAVDETARTVQLKNLDTKKPLVGPNKKVLNVPWATIGIPDPF